ncbi:MAG: efflux RND transporter periplasmic adaptor subunit [Bacteroidia bacterium]|nr:efflux RND transporter periplasmic adaptor subunit [Bacteroidia bacterium]
MKSYCNLILALFLIFSCKENRTPLNVEKSTKAEIIENSESDTVPADKDMKGTIIFPDSPYVIKGYVEVPPQNIYQVSVPVGGILKHTHLLPGMKFKKGEILLFMENQEYAQLQSDFLKTKSLFELTQKNYQRQKELFTNKAISEKEFEITENEYRLKKIEYHLLYKKLQLLHIQPESLEPSSISPEIRIPAPFDGFVTKVFGTTGKFINPGEVILELVNPSDIHLLIMVPENILDRIYIGKKISCFSPYDEKKLFECEIITINKKINADRTVDVHCHFIRFDEKLIPGTILNVNL